MKKLLAGLITFYFLIAGGLSILLGALYKIQSWEMPVILGTTIDLLVAGVVYLGIGVSLMILRSNWYETGPEDRLELDDRRLREAARQERVEDEDELLL